MFLSRLQAFLTVPTGKKTGIILFWFSLSLTFAALYSFLALKIAFSSEYVVQDDARQFVFWMQRFVDPGLLPNDLMVDYYQSITPPGFAAFYWVMAKVGIEPLLLSKLLPMLLGLLTTAYVFGVSMQLLPVPTAGFIATLLLNQSLWLRNDFASGTPKSFAYPLFAAFLYYLLRGAWLPSLLAIALQGLFFPPMATISVVILLLRLLNWQKLRFKLSRNRNDYLFCFIGLAVAVIAMLPYAIASAKFEPLISLNAAKSLPDFYAGARVTFFYLDNNPLQYWFAGPETGILPYVGPVQLYLGLLLPVLIRYPSRFPLISQISGEIKILTQSAIASLGMFFIAHALMFKLYGPSRYTQHSLRIVLAIATGITLAIVLDAFLTWGQEKLKTNKLKPIKLGFTCTFAILPLLILIIYPSFVKLFPRPGYVVGGVPALYQFFAQQPKDIIIASLASEANNLPTFAQRSILTAREYSLPFHTKYYDPIKQRTSELIAAQYTPDLKQAQQFIQKYNVDFWLIEDSAFMPMYFSNMTKDNRQWIQLHQPAATEAISNLQSLNKPALSKLVSSCTAFQTANLIVLQTECIKSM